MMITASSGLSIVTEHAAGLARWLNPDQASTRRLDVGACQAAI
jgi:hypothetical protein